jgi:hypothetical protein
LFAFETTSATLPNPTHDLLLTSMFEPLTLNGDDWCGYDRNVPAGGGGGAVVVVVGGAVVVVGAGAAVVVVTCVVVVVVAGRVVVVTMVVVDPSFQCP